MGLRTPLFDAHQRAGARMVTFGGWEMPLHYGSQIEEHHAVRRDAGVFDVSHMRPVDVTGPQATDYLRRLLANDVARLDAGGSGGGRALYTCMLNRVGGVVDDLIVYRRADGYRLVVNAGTADKDLDWMQQHAAGHAVTIERRDDLAMLAIQGPQARAQAAPLLPGELAAAVPALKPFSFVEADGWLVARTGYTGEDGLEVILPGAEAPALWAALLGAGIRPCGLGARDTLRLEAGMNLYGQDMNEHIDPLSSGLGWTVAWEPADRAFIGREMLEAHRKTLFRPVQVGLVLIGRGVLRAGQRVNLSQRPLGTTTSGGFAPTLGRSIALARVYGHAPHAPGTVVNVDIRGQAVAAQVVTPPFVRHGKVLVDVAQ